jgi:hypothetical protein
MSSSRRWATFLPILSAPLAVLLAIAYVARNDGFGSGDIEGFAFWSALLTLLLLALFRSVSRSIATSNAGVRTLVGAAVGVDGALLFTSALALGMGSMIGAFSFPILAIWTIAAAIPCALAGWLLAPGSATPSFHHALTWVGAALGGLVVVGLLPLGLVYGSMYVWGRAQPETYLVPEGFQGPVFIIFDQAGAAPLPMVDGRRVIEVPQSGVVVTSSAIAEGWKNPEVFRVLNTGIREPVATDWSGADTLAAAVHTHWLPTRMGASVNGAAPRSLSYEAFTLGRHDREAGLEARADVVLDSLWALYAR